MIDGGNAADSRCIYSYLREQLRIAHIDYMIATHPHEDHIGGLPGALNACSVGKIYSPVAEYDSDAFRALLTYAAKQGLALTVPMAGDGFHVGSADVQFLSPGRELASENDLSLVVRITYGETALALCGGCGMGSGTGDGGRGIRPVRRSSKSRTSRKRDIQFVCVFAGSFAGICGDQRRKRQRLRTSGRGGTEPPGRRGAQVFRTDLHGTIICILDEQGFSIITEKGA